MKIRVFQIQEDADAEHVMFQSYESIMEETGKIDPEIYRTVYDGDVDCETLEDVYGLLNTRHPPSYQGHSLSVSDVVEIQEGTEETERGLYFCDSIGFKPLPVFDTTKCEPLHGRKMVIIEPGKPAYAALVDDSLESLQRAVGGYIEITYPFDDNSMVIGNEEAKLIGMEGNRHICGSVYAGPLLIAADDGEGGTTDLTDEQIRTYTEMFAEPEEIQQQEVEADTGFFLYGFM